MYDFLFRQLTKRKRTKIINNLMMGAAIVHPTTALPQVIQIYAQQDASGVSLWTWLGFMAIGLVYTSYAIINRLRPMIISQILWYLIDSLVVIGVILYQH